MQAEINELATIYKFIYNYFCMAQKIRKLMSVRDAAVALDLSEPRIKQMIYRDELKAEKVGNQWIIFESDLDDVKVRREPGRPVKA